MATTTETKKRNGPPLWHERLGTASDLIAAILGMFVALGVLIFLSSLIAAGAGGIDYQLNVIDTDGNLQDFEVVGTIVALAVVFASFFTGGWAAGRLSLRDEPANGAGAGVLFVALVAIFGALGTWVGSEYNAFGNAGLPDWIAQFGADDLTLKGAAAAAGGIVAAGFGGFLGGLTARWHPRQSRNGDE